ncbi:DUF5667 domain-containing protein [Kitasatospora sp. MBT63]|uniref:DUF5667 domain-containing protein n=1 Tax=Kitasatospora sp. MBT63 TaxID=1444768 RepID=UPI00053B053C|nr:DUF5667 domain-containing protein [Kitasatospora sp. MBT63]
MTANVLEHRRAKAFAEALEAHRTESRADTGGAARAGSSRADQARGGSAAMAELLAMAGALGSLPEPELDAEARVVQRAQLMAAFEQEWAGGRPAVALPRQRRHRAVRAVSRSRWGRRLAIGGLVAGVAVGSFAGAAAASTNALPGDPLYGMKRGLEGLQLDWADSDAERGALLLEQASTRLDEAQSLLRRAGSPDTLSPDTVEQVRRALDDMHTEAVRGRDLLRAVYRSNGSLAPMRKLATFAEGEDDRWTTLQSRLPGQLTGQAGKVDQLFDDISEDVAPLHLEQPAADGGQAPGGTGAGGEQSPGAAGHQPGTTGGRPQSPAGTPDPHGKGGTGGATTGGSAPSSAPAGVGGLVNGLTSGLTGGGAAGTPSAGQPDRSASSPAPSADPAAPENQGLTLPPLLPGLLPGLTLN